MSFRVEISSALSASFVRSCTTTASGWALFSGHFDTGGFYESLVANQCFSVTDTGAADLFAERLSCFSWMKVIICDGAKVSV